MTASAALIALSSALPLGQHGTSCKNGAASSHGCKAAMTCNPHLLYDTRHLTASCRQGDWDWPLSSSAMSSSIAVGILLRASAGNGRSRIRRRAPYTRIFAPLALNPPPAHIFCSVRKTRISVSMLICFPSTARYCRCLQRASNIHSSHLTRSNAHTRPNPLSV